MTDIHSLSSELDERLASLFGEDISETGDLEDTGGSPLTELQVLMLTIDWEISDETLNAFNKELENLKRLFAGDPFVPPFLKMLSSLIGYLKSKKSRAHPNTLNVIRSVFASLEKVVETANLSSHEKKSLLEAEIEGFRKLKYDITGVPATPAAQTSEDKQAVSPQEEPKTEDGGVTIKMVRPDQPTVDQVGQINACIREEVAALKGELQRIYTEFDEMRGALSQSRAMIEELRNSVRDLPAISATLKAIQVQISTMGKENASQDVSSGNPVKPEEVWHDPDTVKIAPSNPEAVDQFSFTEETWEKIEQTKTPAEDDAEEGTQREEPKHAFFFFELAGNKYAVDENPVMKSCKISTGKARKVRTRGEVRLEDFGTLFRGIKGGMEAAWKNIPARELKKQRFTIVSRSDLKGPLNTKDHGLMFLASGGKRMALLTDNPPQKEWIEEGLISRSNGGRVDISGKISNELNEQEFRLIINADALL
jgi:hypothetical protein